MDQPTQRRIALELLDHVEAGTTELADDCYEEPVASYTDPVRFEREKALLFAGDVPLVVGLSGQLASPGDCLPFDDYGPPLLLLRDGTGRFRTFLNVCRHRGARLVETAGRHRRMACPYHGWTYDLDGQLVGVPGAAGFTGLDRACRGLAELPADEAGGILFVKPRLGAAPFSAVEHLAGLAPELESWGVGEQAYHDDRTLDRPVNWKTAVDTFGEVYHFAYAHRDTLAKRTVSNTMVTARFGPHQRFAAPTHAIRQIRRNGADPTGDVSDAVSFVYLLFPNTALLVSRTVQLYTIAPGAHPGASLARQRFFVSQLPETAEERTALDETCDFYHQVVRDEDWRIGQGAETGLRSGANATLVFGRNEPCLHHLHDAWHAALTPRAP